MINHSQRIALVAGVSLVGVLFVVRAWAGGVPTEHALVYAGKLEQVDGTPVTGEHAIQVSFWKQADPPSGEMPLCQYPSELMEVTNGRFSVSLPKTCESAVKSSSDVWVEVALDGVPFAPSKLGAVPYALEAGHALTADRASAELQQQIVPSGAVMPFNLSSCPAGWSPLADAAGRVIVGASNPDALGTTFGSDEVSLQLDQVPPHAHEIADPGHAHSPESSIGLVIYECTNRTDMGYASGGQFSSHERCANNRSGLGVRGATAPSQTGISATQQSGGGKAFDNRQASLALLYCQKD
jgi:microcystin-dependent protein